MQKYIIGQSPIPCWCRKQLLQYKRMDGRTGFEFWYEADGVLRTTELAAGDELLRMNGKTIFKRKEQRR